MKIKIVILALFATTTLLLACNNKSKPEVHFKIVDYSEYNLCNMTRGIQFYTVDSNLIDSEYIIDCKDNLNKKKYYENGKRTVICYYDDNRIFLEHDEINDIHTYYDYKGYITKIKNYKKSTVLKFYKQSKIKKEFNVYNNDNQVYYRNSYSISGEIKSTYRISFDDVNLVGDTLVIEPTFPNGYLNLKDFTFKIDIFDSKKTVVKTYHSSGSHPIFKLPYTKGTKLEWTKTICDSIGCYSLVQTFTDTPDKSWFNEDGSMKGEGD